MKAWISKTGYATVLLGKYGTAEMNHVNYVERKICGRPENI